MTGVDADLATLRERLSQGYNLESTEAALARVEAELSRLRDKVDPYVDWQQVAESRAEDIARLHDERDDARAMTRIANSRCARLQQALAKADKAASKAHDAMWAMDFDKTAASSLERDEWKRLRERASKAVWAIHNLLRPLIDEGEALAGLDTPADSQEDQP